MSLKESFDKPLSFKIGFSSL